MAVAARVTMHEMLGTFLWAGEPPPDPVRVIEVPEIRSRGASRP